MAHAYTYQCPNCAGVLAYNAQTDLLECASCGSAFAEGEVDKALPIDPAVAPQQAQHVRTVDEFLDNAPWEVANEDAAAFTTTVRYACPSCGAEVVADQSTVSTSCPYCGNNMLVAGIAGEDNLPQLILPFSVTREQAEERMRHHFERKWYLSRKFDAMLEHIQAVYVPYYLYDVDVRGWADYIAYDTVDSGDNTSTYYYAFKRAGHASFRGIPVDGSSKMPDAHMDAIAPFSWGAMRSFSTSYLAGYLAEVADEGAQACRMRAEARACRSFEQDMEADVRAARKVDGISEVVSSETDARTVGARTCVLPVWLMHCTWGDEQMLFAVNGETGKCVGNLPISGARRGLTVGGVALALTVLMFFLLGALSEGWREMGNISLVIGLAIAFVAVVTMLVDQHFKRQMLTALEATNASASYDSEGLVLTERWQTEDSYGSKKKALRKLAERNASLAE